MASTHNVNHFHTDDYNHTQNSSKKKKTFSSCNVAFFSPVLFLPLLQPLLHSFFVRPPFSPFSLSVLLHISFHYPLLLSLLCSGCMKTKIKTHTYSLLDTESETETALNWTILCFAFSVHLSLPVLAPFFPSSW